MQNKVQNSLWPNILLWFSVLLVVWTVVRLFIWPEVVSELILKPMVWLGITAVCIWRGIIPKAVIAKSRASFTRLAPFWQIWLLPAVGIIAFFSLLYGSKLADVTWLGQAFFLAVIINSATAIVEELVFRGVLYVWLLEKLDEFSAFGLVQVFFLLLHVPILWRQFESWPATFARVYFIVWMSAIYTGIFRLNKSIYSSILAHAVWNTLIALVVLN